MADGPLPDSIQRMKTRWHAWRVVYRQSCDS